MPITSSAKKALRQSLARRQRNLAQTKLLKEALKKFKKSPTGELLPLAYQRIDKAVKNHLLHRNKAARLKGQLAKLLKVAGR